MSIIRVVGKRQTAVNHFRERVKERISETGISMSELAQRANVGRAYLYRVVSGEQTPTLSVADRIARALGLEIDTRRTDPTRQPAKKPA